MDPLDEPVAGARVGLMLLSQDVLGGTSEVTAANGSFVLGPLLPGPYELTARRDSARNLVAPPPAVIEAGMEGVVLRMRAGGAIRGKVVDAATNEPVQARLMIEPAERPLQGLGLGSFRFGGYEFEYKTLAEGSYNIIATTQGGLVGIAENIAVVSGSTTRGVVVRVEPAAKLRLLYEGDETWAFLQVRIGDVLIDGARIRSGTSAVLDVPPGELAVTRSNMKGSPVEEKTTRIAAGEERELSFVSGD